MNNNNKIAFDPTICFTFFGSWLKSIETLETEQDKNSMSYSLFKAIANYSMYDVEPEFSNNPILSATWILLEKEIDSSIDRRKRGFAKDELNEKYQSIIQAIVDSPQASLRDIGSITGTDKEMVRRVKKKYAKQIQEAIESNNSEASIDADAVNADVVGTVAIEGDNNYYDDYYAGSDSMRQDTDKTVRQFYYDDDNLPF